MNNDTSRCTASLCPIAETCASFVVPGGEWTPYCDFSLQKGECGFFIPVERVEE